MTLNSRMTATTAVACVLVSTVLLPLFSDILWFVIGAGAVIAVAGTGALTRLRTLPVSVCLAATVVGLLLYLNLVFEVRHSLLLVIPTPTSITRLWHLAGTGLHDANRYAPPAPNLPGLLLLAAAGVGITAVLTDLIAVRLRSTALAGLPLLVLFTVPVTMNAPHSQLTTVLVFCLSGAGYLAMLSADGRERIRVWGRLVSLWRSAPRYGRTSGGTFDGAGSDGRGLDGRGERRPGPDTRALAAAGRRVGLASIVLALCAPLIVPGLHASKLFSSGPGIGGTGSSGGPQSLSLPGALNQAVSQLHESQPRALFTYSTNASQSQQASDAEYFRQYVFNLLGDKGWKVDNWAARSVPVGSIPGPAGLSDLTAPETVRTIVRAGKDLRSPNTQPTFLPLPYPAIQVTAPGKWLVDPDRMVYSTSDSITDQTYSVTSMVVDPSQAQLQAVPGLARTAELAPDLQLPSAYRTSALKELAVSNTAGQTTEFAKVNALATWLSGPQFTYSLAAAQPTSAQGLVNFLTKGKSGYCVHYAYAMTVLTRLLGIPARFVVGYTAGTRQKDGSYVVSTTDSHAWTEVYFPSMGWIRFEPTPAGQGTANTPDYMTGGAGNGQAGGAPPPVSATENPSALKTPPPVGGGLGVKTIRPEDTAGGLAGSAKRAGTPWTAVALAVIAALVLALGLISVVAGPSQHMLAGHPGILRRRPRTATVAIVGVAAAALVALALYRLLARTSGLNLGIGWATVGIAFGATAAVALITPAVFRLVLRRWRWMRADDDAGRAHAAWREFHDDLADFGVTSRASEPPRTLAARVTTTLAEPAAEAVARLALAEDRASYAARPTGSQNLRRDGTAARRGLAANARRSTRWRATVFPASMMTALGEAAARIPDRITTLRF